ncbi:hypothetical protein HDU96_007090 [Phlyctochytrium bullatum]|nr:hypothetical protein HDU96_007090 [Phlyctochytrium bullatum]
MSNLLALGLSGNRLNGSIPAEVENLEKIVLLRIENNYLNGTLAPEVGNMRNLQELFIYANKLSGPIPATIGNLTALSNLRKAIGKPLLSFKAWPSQKPSTPKTEPAASEILPAAVQTSQVPLSSSNIPVPSAVEAATLPITVATDSASKDAVKSEADYLKRNTLFSGHTISVAAGPSFTFGTAPGSSYVSSTTRCSSDIVDEKTHRSSIDKSGAVVIHPVEGATSSAGRAGGPFEWGWDEVKAWLEAHQFGELCVEKFKAADATGMFLHQLHTDHLLTNELLRSELGVVSVSQRLRFRDALTALFACEGRDQPAFVEAPDSGETPPPYLIAE